MNSAELAETFVKNFCSGSIDGISSLLAEDFTLSGPLYQFSSRDEYLASLNDNLEPDPDSSVISITDTDNEATVFYTYHGKIIAQLFKCAAGKITETILVFDTSDATLK